MSRIFITGAGGFLGTAVLDALATLPDHDLVLLVRSEGSVASPPHRAQIVVGDITDPESYRKALDGCDTVLHMAAMTGKAAPTVYTDINHRASEALLAASKAAGVANFIFVSTIASTYPKQKYYPYAQSKAAAEAAVRASGLAYTILRPTIILGDGSPIADTLGKIAGAPVIPLPQSGGPVSVQPVHVRDVAAGIVRLLDQEQQQNEALDLGGPEALPFRDYLTRIHIALKGKEPGFLPVPLAPIQWGLSLLEPVARKFMPATAGQLSVFGNASTAQDNWLMQALRPDMVSLVDMLPHSGPPAPPSGGATPRPPLTDTQRRDLVAEADLFCRYLAGSDADTLITDTYIDGVAKLGMTDDLAPFEAAVLRLARRGPLMLTIADAFAGFFQRSGSLRRRLILMLAIVEKAPQTNARFRVTPDDGPMRAALGLVGAGLKGGVALAAGLVICLPLALASRLRS